MAGPYDTCRELSEEFGDVGLMTGDVVINANANCIVMTTEILRSMIYRGSELLREVAWVVFDEVHYMQVCVCVLVVVVWGVHPHVRVGAPVGTSQLQLVCALVCLAAFAWYRSCRPACSRHVAQRIRHKAQLPFLSLFVTLA